MTMENDPFLRFAPPGHFYSPIPSLSDIEDKKAVLWSRPENIPGINLNPTKQLALIEKLGSFYDEQPFSSDKADGLRYFFNCGFFSYCDGLILYSLIRHLEPKRIIEVGSGFSSCNIMDTNELFFGNEIRCTFIEPYPDRLMSNISQSDREKHEVIVEKLQDVPLEKFAELGENDILFIDSSHVSKCGSDVNYIIFELLPSLKKNIYIHFHDIFYPFEYPLEWYHKGRCWNEAYILRAFLQFNDSFEIVLFNDYMGYFYKPALKKNMPICLKNSGGSLWLRKTK